MAKTTRGSGRKIPLKRLALRWLLFLGGLGFFAGSALLVFVLLHSSNTRSKLLCNKSGDHLDLR